MTELEFYQAMQKLYGYGSSFYRIINNRGSISYHLYFDKRKINYNFWYCKIREEASISENNENLHNLLKLKELIRTKSISKFQSIIEKLINE